MTNRTQPTTSAKILYRPVGLASSVLAGVVAGAIYKKIWAAATDADDDGPPKPLERDQTLKMIFGAALIQGAIFAVVKAATQRGGARVFERATGEWPGQ